MKEAQIVNCGTIADAADAERLGESAGSETRGSAGYGRRQMLVQRAGLDLVRLRAGLERVTLYAMGEPTITGDTVRQVVPAAPDAQTDFGIAKAIGRNDAADTLRELPSGARCRLDAGDGDGTAGASRPSVVLLRGCGTMDAVLRTDLALKSSAGRSPHVARAACRGNVRRAEDPGYALLVSRARDPRLVATGGISVDDPLRRHLVDN